MKELIDVFRMDEIPSKKRAKIIIELGRCINNQYGASLTEPIVYEFVSILDPKNDIFKNEHFVKTATK